MCRWWFSLFGGRLLRKMLGPWRSWFWTRSQMLGLNKLGETASFQALASWLLQNLQNGNRNRPTLTLMSCVPFTSIRMLRPSIISWKIWFCTAWIPSWTLGPVNSCCRTCGQILAPSFSDMASFPRAFQALKAGIICPGNQRFETGSYPTGWAGLGRFHSCFLSHGHPWSIVFSTSM